MAQIDLNCDLGEGGPHDAELLSLVTSTNIACGGHAGDPMTMMRTLRLANQNGVSIGAHPGYFDREHFGRRELDLPHDQIMTECLYQVGALFAIAKAHYLKIAYIKPHGALYNQAVRERYVALDLLAAARVFDVPLLGLPNSQMELTCGSSAPFVREGFADRRYRSDGTLVPRDQPGAFVESPEEACDQAERLIAEQGVRSLCVHGDNPDAVAFVRKLRDRLIARGHQIKQFA